MVLAEAQAPGLPVVATRWENGGRRRRGHRMASCRKRDPGVLAHALRSCLTDDGLRSRLGEAARPWIVEHFDLARQTAALEDRYDQWSGVEHVNEPLVDVVVPLHRGIETSRPLSVRRRSELQGVATPVTVVLHDLEPEGTLRDRIGPEARVLVCRDGIPSPSGPRNIGLEAATAPFVFFLDSDDSLAPDCLARFTTWRRPRQPTSSYRRSIAGGGTWVRRSWCPARPHSRPGRAPAVPPVARARAAAAGGPGRVRHPVPRRDPQR